MNLTDFDHFNEEEAEEAEGQEEDESSYHRFLPYWNRAERDRILLVGLDDYVKMRRRYGRWILSLTSLWIVAVLVAVFFQGFQGFQYALGPKFYLPDSILITLLGTSTANVIGLLIIVANYLFPKSGRDLLDFLDSKQEPES